MYKSKHVDWSKKDIIPILPNDTQTRIAPQIQGQVSEVRRNHPYRKRYVATREQAAVSYLNSITPLLSAKDHRDFLSTYSHNSKQTRKLTNYQRTNWEKRFTKTCVEISSTSSTSSKANEIKNEPVIASQTGGRVHESCQKLCI